MYSTVVFLCIDLSIGHRVPFSWRGSFLDFPGFPVYFFKIYCAGCRSVDTSGLCSAFKPESCCHCSSFTRKVNKKTIHIDHPFAFDERHICLRTEKRTETCYAASLAPHHSHPWRTAERPAWCFVLSHPLYPANSNNLHYLPATQLSNSLWVFSCVQVGHDGDHETRYCNRYVCIQSLSN